MSLRPHIEKKHEMQCTEYYERFMTTYAEKSPTVECEKKGITESVDSKINQCEYQCQVCTMQIIMISKILILAVV